MTFKGGNLCHTAHVVSVCKTKDVT